MELPNNSASWAESLSSDDQLSYEQINQMFEKTFACPEDRRRLFEDYRPQTNYHELLCLAS